MLVIRKGAHLREITRDRRRDSTSCRGATLRGRPPSNADLRMLASFARRDPLHHPPEIALLEAGVDHNAANCDLQMNLLTAGAAIRNAETYRWRNPGPSIKRTKPVPQLTLQDLRGPISRPTASSALMRKRKTTPIMPLGVD